MIVLIYKRQIISGKPSEGKVYKKFKKGLMATWDELVDEKDSNREADEANLALMDLTLSDSEFESCSGSKSDKEDREYLNLSWSDLIHDFMSLCQD